MRLGSFFSIVLICHWRHVLPFLCRNSQRSRNWTDLNSLANRCSIRAATNNQDSRLNTNCEINNRTAANLHALNIPAAIGLLMNTLTGLSVVNIIRCLSDTYYSSFLYSRECWFWWHGLKEQVDPVNLFTSQFFKHAFFLPLISCLKPIFRTSDLIVPFSCSECQYNRDIPYSEVRDDDGEEECACNDGAARAVVPDSVSESSRRSSLGNDAGFPQKVHRQSAKQKLRQLQELVAMVQVKDEMFWFCSHVEDVLLFF